MQITVWKNVTISIQLKNVEEQFEYGGEVP